METYAECVTDRITQVSVLCTRKQRQRVTTQGFHTLAATRRDLLNRQQDARGQRAEHHIQVKIQNKQVSLYQFSTTTSVARQLTSLVQEMARSMRNSEHIFEVPAPWGC